MSLIILQSLPGVDPQLPSYIVVLSSLALAVWGAWKVFSRGRQGVREDQQKKTLEATKPLQIALDESSQVVVIRGNRIVDLEAETMRLKEDTKRYKSELDDSSHRVTRLSEQYFELKGEYDTLKRRVNFLEGQRAHDGPTTGSLS